MNAALKMFVVSGLLLAAGQAWANVLESGTNQGAALGQLDGAAVSSTSAQPASGDLGVPSDPLSRSVYGALKGGALDRIGPARVDGERLLRAYATRGFAPLWFGADGEERLPSRRAQAVMEVLAGAGKDGLVPDHYYLNELGSRWSPNSLAERAELDLLLTDAVLNYATHLRIGRVPPRSITSDFHYRPEAPDAAAVVTGLASTDDVTAYLASFAPPHAVYAGLRALLADYRAMEQAGAWPTVPVGRKISKGAKGRVVTAVRARLIATGDLDPALGGSDLFDDQLDRAVRAFQARNGLLVDGVIGPATFEALNVSVGERIQSIIATMERLRWLPTVLGRRHVFVNVAGFDLNVVENGKVTTTMPVIVGTVRRKTPLFSSEINNVVFNPPWTVPQRLAREDFLPKLREDPNYLANRNIRLYSSWGSDAEVVDPASIDWSTVGRREMSGYRLRQAPGSNNALGHIKFNMPNPFAVYLHDTPQQYKFRRTVRAFSSGCVRVGEPDKLAEVVFEGTPRWDASRRASAIRRGRTAHIGLERSVPVHLFYLTAWRDEAGTAQFRNDIYGWDRLLLRSIERRMARTLGVASASISPGG